MTASSSRWREHLVFRDALRAEPALAAEYAALTRELALRAAQDLAGIDPRERYSEAKAAFVRRVLRSAAVG